MLEQQAIIFNEDRDALYQISDKCLGTSLEGNNMEIVADALRKFRSLNQVSAFSTARLLHGINQNWLEWDHETGENFLNWSVRETGYDVQTIKRRVCEWEFLSGHYIPKKFRSKINDYTIRQLDKAYSVCVNVQENKEGGYLNFVEEDYEITEKQWLALSEAIDDSVVVEVVREIKGKEKNSNQMTLKIDSDGTVWAYQKKKQEVVGHLFVEKESDLVKKAIRRIIDNSGITPRYEY